MLTALIIVAGSLVFTFAARDVALRAIDRLPLADDVRKLDARVTEAERVIKALDDALVAERGRIDAQVAKVATHDEYIETAKARETFTKR